MQSLVRRRRSSEIVNGGVTNGPSYADAPCQSSHPSSHLRPERGAGEPRRSSRASSSASPSRAPSRASASSSSRWRGAPSGWRSSAPSRRRPRARACACAGSSSVDQQARRAAARRVAHRARARHARRPREVPRLGAHQGRRAQAGASASSRRSASTRCACSTRSPTASREVEGLGDKRRDGAREGVEGAARAARRDGLPAGARREPRPSRRASSRATAPRAMTVVSRDPYRLALDVRGVGFKTADRIAATIGVAPDSPERMQAGVLQVLHDVTEAGHVWTAAGGGARRAPRRCSGSTPTTRPSATRLEHAVERRSSMAGACRRRGRATASASSTRAEMHAAEVRLARRLRGDRRAPPRAARRRGATRSQAFEARARVELAPEQRSAVEEAAAPPGAGRHGRPGRRQDDDRPRDPRGARAREGRGAPRRADGARRQAHERGDGRGGDHAPPPARVRPQDGAFKRDARRPIEAGAVVVDEASMLDLPMADALAQAIAPGTRLVLVGDVDQLPSVGPGAVLRDVIASGVVPCGAPAPDLPPGRAEPHRHRTPTASTTASRPSRRARRRATPTSSSSSAATPSRPATTVVELVDARASPTASASIPSATSRCSRR